MIVPDLLMICSKLGCTWSAIDTDLQRHHEIGEVRTCWCLRASTWRRLAKPVKWRHLETFFIFADVCKVIFLYLRHFSYCASWKKDSLQMFARLKEAERGVNGQTGAALWQVLAKKMTVLYALSQGQLSKQYHYDSWQHIEAGLAPHENECISWHGQLRVLAVSDVNCRCMVPCGRLMFVERHRLLRP